MSFSDEDRTALTVFGKHINWASTEDLEQPLDPDKTTIGFVWTVGEACLLPEEEQMFILNDAVRFLVKQCPEAPIRKHRFGAATAPSLVYQDNPVISIV